MIDIMVYTEEHVNKFYKELIYQLEYNINGQSPAMPHYSDGVETSFSSDSPNFFASHSRTEINFPSYEPHFSLYLPQPLDSNGLMARGFQITIQIPTDEYWDQFHPNYQDFQDWGGSDHYYYSSDPNLEDLDIATYYRDFFEDDYYDEIIEQAKEIVKGKTAQELREDDSLRESVAEEIKGLETKATDIFG